MQQAVEGTGETFHSCSEAITIPSHNRLPVKSDAHPSTSSNLGEIPGCMQPTTRSVCKTILNVIPGLKYHLLRMTPLYYT